MYQTKNYTCFLQIILVMFVLVFCPGLSIAEAAKTGLPDYVLGTGDMVRVQVYNEETLYLDRRGKESCFGRREASRFGRRTGEIGLFFS